MLLLKHSKLLMGVTLISLFLPFLLVSCSAGGGGGTQISTLVGTWQNSLEAEIESMPAEEKQFYENLSSDKKDEIRETRRVIYDFQADGRFEKKHLKKVDKGSWKLSQDKKQLTITYNDGQVDVLIVKKLLSGEVRVGKEFGLQKDDIILEPY